VQFLSATGHPRPDHFVDTPELRDQPLIMISHADASAYARWRGGRLPSEVEWTLLSGQAGCRDLGRVWEWTVDREESGWVVRGGPWRNQSGPGLPDHHSWERVASPDVGFRCVYDLT
jgi:formylglycine-generating enzyme required for sulfatase activity